MSENNARQSFAELNELRQKNEQCDVTIQIDGETFPCHRTVLSLSPFFKALFDGNFSESQSNLITLKEVEATAFQEILDALYTGTLTVNSENACRLLKASSFLGLREFENSCIAFTEKNNLVDNLVEVCMFAHVLQEEKLFKAMVKSIADNFVELAATHDFSHLPLSVFEAILSHETENRNENVIFDEIIKWVAKNPNEHSTEVIEHLLEAVKLTKVDVSLVAKLLSLTKMPKENVDDIISESDLNKTLAISYASGRPTVEVYLKATTQGSGDWNNFISLAYQPFNENKWTLMKTFDCPFDNLKTVVVGSRQYFLSYSSNNSAEVSCKFWMVECNKQTTLRKPPAIDEHYELLALKNTIFIYFTDLKARIINESVTNFTQTNINHLYFYNCEADKWYAAPEMNQPVKGAALIGHDYSIYLLGGLQGPKFEDYYPHIQRWDARRLNWDCVTNGALKFCYGSACVYKDCVYLSGSCFKNQLSSQFCKYDIIRNQLTTLKEMCRVRANHTLTVFSDVLYAIDNNSSIPFSGVEKYEFVSPEKWIEEPSLPRKIVCNNKEFLTGDITAAVVSPFFRNKRSFKIF